LKAGLYKKKSIALAGADKLIHVGYLGGTPPAVAGLADYQFTAAKEPVIYTFAAVNADKVTTIEDAMATILDYLSDVIESQEEQNTVKLLSEQIIFSFNKNKEAAMQQAQAQQQAESGQEFADLQLKFAAIEAENAQLKEQVKEFAQREQALQEREFEAFFSASSFVPKDKEAVKTVFFSTALTAEQKTLIYSSITAKQDMQAVFSAGAGAPITLARTQTEQNTEILKAAGLL
jgi:hypothetical protein